MGNTGEQENNGGAQGEAGAQGTRTFTQDEMNAIIADRLSRERSKYADYDELRQKALAYDEAEEASKSELQKQTERADKLQAQYDALVKSNDIRKTREKVAKDTGVPLELLTGADEESCKAQADAILKFAKPKSYPGTRTNGGRQTPSGSTADAAMRELAHQIFGKGE